MMTTTVMIMDMEQMITMTSGCALVETNSVMVIAVNSHVGVATSVKVVVKLGKWAKSGKKNIYMNEFEFIFEFEFESECE